ncbi:hypothetical protein D1B33_16600 [Lysinibacillus yapensis]|uniref:ATPase BadF/BadG/BcrA/BcrD type domain-containing protein n=1 Tax=Ureibacillus yapensis TaxID=2304605 RepID=A0A396S403_9BACL|nr:BadF/BadG/BcrA/BcrD ATPase family protein [Lysinibacillus yapensis]RHW32785.1 hypothetical protein D1B33_16600 [Lysinibacillus yapensis]
MEESIILAVDGGATKTTLTVRTSSGKCLFEKTARGSNYQTIGETEAVTVLGQLLCDAYISAKVERIHVAVFAIAGIDTKADLEAVTHIVKQSLKRAPFIIEELLIENDGHSTLLGLVEGKPGALLIAGTGSIAFATDGNGKVVRSGGWGHRASDQGSGYWIGRQILQAVFKSEDGVLPPTLLKQLAFQQLNIYSIDELVAWLYQPHYTNALTASLSPVLNEAIMLGDEQALVIAQQATQELSLLVKSSLSKIEYGVAPFPLYLNGGILQHNSFILERLQELLRNAYPKISFNLCSERPIEYIAKRALL